jgi:hypothetical protein
MACGIRRQSATTKREALYAAKEDFGGNRQPPDQRTLAIAIASLAHE